MSVVVDASIALSWAYHDEETPATREILQRVVRSGGWAPLIWRLEVANGLQQSVRRRWIDAAFRDDALSNLGSLNIQLDPETNDHAWTRTLALAERFGLTLYDAAYLEVAERRNLPLATLDRELGSAAKRLGVELLDT